MKLLAVFLLGCLVDIGWGYQIGVGRADVTGPIAQVTLMGYGRFDQKGAGIHMRLFSRAFIVNDGKNRLAFVSVDAGMMGDGVRIQVLKTLQQKFKGLYNADNVMISATHTHSGPGGYLMHTFFDIPSGGFCRESFDALVSGIVKSIERAHMNLAEGRVLVATTTVTDKITANRSPTAYLMNPKEEREKYKFNVDKELIQLQFVTKNGSMIGAFNWFPIHGTSLNYTNTLVSSDNIGWASVSLEKYMSLGEVAGKTRFVGAFASSNLGDVSPNVRGPKCHQSNTECDVYSKCKDMNEECYAIGVLNDMYHSAQYAADILRSEATTLINLKKGIEVIGPVQSIHQYVDMPTAKAEVLNKTTGKLIKVQGCIPAMGYSAGAGTTDGQFLPFLKQGMKNSTWWIDAITNMLARPTPQDIACHAPKPILLATGYIDYPFEWQPRIVSTQLARIGNIIIACVPGEFTTMSGRRMKEVLMKSFGRNSTVIIAGLCNTYSDYIATFEEYQVQRYEGGSTLYGPHTLSLHLAQYQKLANALIQNKKLERGPEPKGLDPTKMFTTIQPVTPDSPKSVFGKVLLQPKDLKVINYGDSVKATFVAGNPRNNQRLEETHFQIEGKRGNDTWMVERTDADVDTKMFWRQTDAQSGASEVDIEWAPWHFVDNLPYRIRYFGSYRTQKGEVKSFESVTNTFLVKKGVKKVLTIGELLRERED